MSRKATLELVIKREGVAIAEKALVQLGNVGEAVAKKFQGSMSATDKSVLQLAAQVQTLNNSVTKTGVSGTSSFTSMRAPLMSVTRQILELNPAVAQLSSLLGTMAIGSAWMIGILAGVAALAFAWDRVSASAKAAKREQEDGKRVLEGVRDRNRNPILGGLPAAITSETFRQQDLFAQRAEKLAQMPTAIKHGWQEALQEQISNINKQISESRNLIQHGDREVERLKKEHNDRLAEENRQARDKELAAMKKFKADQRAYDDLLSERNTVGLPGLATSTTDQATRSAAASRIANMQIPAAVIASATSIGERASSIVREAARIALVIAEITEEQKKAERNSALKNMGIQSGLQLLGTFGGAKGSMLSGVANSAMAGFAAGGPWGAAIAGVTSLTQGIFGLSKASKEAAAAQAAAQREFQMSFALYKKGAFGTVTDTDRALEAARQQYAANEKQIQELYGGKKNETERERLLADNKRAYEAYVAQIRATAAEMEKAAKADGFRKSIEEFTRVIDNLQGFQNELKLGSLSTLSPAQKLAEAKRQYEDVLGRARGGDVSAADQLPQFARAFLEAARSMYASGSGYQQAFQRVVLDTDELSKMFESQRAIAQQSLDQLKVNGEVAVKAAEQAHEDHVAVVQVIEQLIEETRNRAYGEETTGSWDAL